MKPKRPSRTPLAQRELDEALARLPRVKASADFSRKTLARLRAGRASRRRGWLAVAAAMVMAFALGLLVTRPGPQESKQATLERLRHEHQAIEQDLAELRRLRAEPLPTIYVGGDEQFDVVLDAAKLVESRRGVTARQRATLTSYSEPPSP